jgi:hypothetical protein
MMMYFTLFVVLFLMRFSESRLIQAIKPMNQTCLNFGHVHDCRFYSCFEERFPCGSTYWILKWGYKYCTRMKKSSGNFDQIGQDLLKQISKCLTDKLIQQRFYTLKTVNCEQLRSAGQRIVHDCYMTNAKLFCNAFKDKNRDCFMQLIDNEDRHDLTMIRTLSSVGQKCTPKKKLIDMRPTGKMNQCIPSSNL